MAAITTFAEALAKMASKGFYIPHWNQSTGTGTSATAGSGFLNVVPMFGRFSTLPGTLVSLPTPADGVILTELSGVALSVRGVAYGWTHKLGTLNLAATGNQFTHDAATFPLLRSRMGQASQPIPLMPFLYVTTALTTTAAVIRLRNVAGTDGYVDQDGNTVVGTKSITFPSATTAVQTGLLLPLEDTDYAIRDIQSIEVTTASATGAADVYAFEPIAPIYSPVTSTLPGMIDLLGETLTPLELKAAVATSGTVTSYFGPVVISNASGGGTSPWQIMGFKNT